jgi:hypothetical protein
LRNPVQTKTERREYYLQVMRRPGIRLKVRPDEISIRDGLAFVRGTILVFQSAADGGEMRIELRYLEICQRMQDGSWQAVWGMDGPVQEYVPGAQKRQSWG